MTVEERCEATLQGSVVVVEPTGLGQGKVTDRGVAGELDGGELGGRGGDFGVFLGLVVLQLGRTLMREPGDLGYGEDTGRLTVGAKADIVVFDSAAPWRVTPDVLKSAGKNTPFAGYELQGRARYTLVGGDVRLDT